MGRTTDDRLGSAPPKARSRRRRKHHPAAVSRIAVAATSVAATVLTMAGLAVNASAEETGASVPPPSAVSGPRPASAPASDHSHAHTRAHTRSRAS